MYHKYPKTLHLPWSEGLTDDDKKLESTSIFHGKEVIVTEKLDGENCSMYCNHIHARSLDSKHHESRTWVKQFHAQICNDIPMEYRICGENLYAKHSIFYLGLPSYFLAFAMYDNNNKCLSWDEMSAWFELIGIKTVPVLYRGIWNENIIRDCWTGNSIYGGEQEGYVVRLAESFSCEDHFLAKFVRKNHVQTDQHWLSQAIVPNKLRE